MNLNMNHGHGKRIKMADPNTLRILQIDGGGARGYMPLLFLKDFVNLWGINQADIWEQFDVICGTSAGGITALYIANGNTIDDLLSLFTTQVPYVFSLTSLTPSVRPNLASKIALVIANIPFYQSSGPTENMYGAGLLVSTIQSHFGSLNLQNLKTNVIIPSYRNDTSTYVVFSNINNAQFSGQNELVSNVALATSAAPLYLPLFTLPDTHPYMDGGVFQNNASQFGRILAQMIKPTASRTCILSLGTGLGKMGFDPDSGDVIDPRVAHLIEHPSVRKIVKNFDDPDPNNAIQILFSLFDISCTGGQESISLCLNLESNYTLHPLYYYRFQPQLAQDINTDLDNTDPEVFSYYQATEMSWFENDINNITTFLGHLTA